MGMMVCGSRSIIEVLVSRITNYDVFTCCRPADGPLHSGKMYHRVTVSTNSAIGGKMRICTYEMRQPPKLFERDYVATSSGAMGEQTGSDGCVKAQGCLE